MTGVEVFHLLRRLLSTTEGDGTSTCRAEVKGIVLTKKTRAKSTVRHVGQNKLDELFKLFRKVELAEQTRFSSEMAHE